MPGPQTEAVWAWIDVKEANMDFRSGSGAKNLPSNTVDMGLITGGGTKIQPVTGQLSLGAPTTEPVIYGPAAATTETCVP